MPKVSKGFATWAGVVGAGGAFLLALATFMDTFNQLDPLAGLGPLAAAAGVLWKVIDGRMKQATALAQRPAATASLGFATGGVVGGTSSNATGTYTLHAGEYVVPAEAEPGDPDALPDYATDENIPPDTGDTSANGDTGEREA